ncbi:MAG: DNA mismatch repair endonuclease MutL [Bacteroidales bacterium]|nr:DNA mismatch repair endonuclease MutL [Bacteroidales bacterium]
MGKLKVLSARISNMIAAGEVVQRPASVVKELMENAVDAGADDVRVVITDAGRTLIQVIDNGSGMSPSDAVLCFERHATSKIATAADLENILTYGFRGEALASIAAVSEVTLRTRREQDDTGTQVTISGTSEVKTSSVSAPAGSNFAVRNLFYNTPARRKFLKSDNVEFKHIVEEFTRVAIPRPDISFTLTHNGKEVFVLRKAKSLKFRIQDLLGRNVMGDVVDVEAETSVVKISGFAGRPESARKALGNQFFFVGGRYFRSPYLHKAVMKAYEEFVPEGLTPSYFLFLEVDPHSIDVNIHPTKTEIKFEDDNVVFQVLFAVVREALGKGSFGASLDFDSEGAVEFPQRGRGFEEYRGAQFSPSVEFDPAFDPFDSGSGHDSFAPAPSAPSSAGGNSAPAPYSLGGLSAGPKDYGRLFDSVQVSADAMVIQGKFIVTRSASGIMIVNIRRAWERILYEQALRALADGVHVTQTALFPVQVRVGVEQRLLLDENAALLSSLGFDINPIGTDTVAVGGVPEGYSCEPGKVEQMIGDLLLILSDCRTALEEVMQQKTASKFAMLGSVNARVPDSPQGVRNLLDMLFACENAEFTSGGRRIISVMDVDEIEKRF